MSIDEYLEKLSDVSLKIKSNSDYSDLTKTILISGYLACTKKDFKKIKQNLEQ